MISHSDCRGYWEKVSRGCMLRSWVLNDFSLNHVERVGISPESLVGIKSIIHSPVHCDILVFFVFHYWNCSKINFEFDEIWAALDNLDDGFFTRWTILIQNCPLLNKSSFLILNLLIKFSIDNWEWISPVWEENVCSFACDGVSFLLWGPFAGVNEASIDVW